MTVSDNLLNTKLSIGDKVKIKKVDWDGNRINLEDYYYLKDFENKMGSIWEKTRNLSGVYTYRVNFSEDKFGYFYEHDLELQIK
jgi:hypothetical protein